MDTDHPAPARPGSDGFTSHRSALGGAAAVAAVQLLPLGRAPLPVRVALAALPAVATAAGTHLQARQRRQTGPWARHGLPVVAGVAAGAGSMLGLVTDRAIECGLRRLGLHRPRLLMAALAGGYGYLELRPRPAQD